MRPITQITGRLGNQMFQFAYLYSQAKDRGTDYYFQDEFYFEKYKDDIKRIFSTGILSEPLNAIAIHVRRTDMVNNNFDINLSETDYYKRAMELFPNEEFIVFSDDIEWCKAQPIFQKKCTFYHADEIADLNCMASCKGVITANSSYSWWAAYLNPNPNKKIVCPKYEYIDHIERRKRPKEWITI